VLLGAIGGAVVTWYLMDCQMNDWKLASEKADERADEWRQEAADTHGKVEYWKARYNEQLAIAEKQQKEGAA
jgi:hypothetical protein